MHITPDFEFSIEFLDAARAKFSNEYNALEEQSRTKFSRKNKVAMQDAYDALGIAEGLSELIRKFVGASQTMPISPKQPITIDSDTLDEIVQEAVSEPAPAQKALMKLARFHNEYNAR